MFELRCLDYSLQKTLECGQIFRAYKQGNTDTYRVHSRDSYCLVTQDNNRLLIEPYGPMTEEQWERFFNTSEDVYSCKKFLNTPFLRKAYDFSQGIHILQQDPWETLVSFIISQRNNIPRIKQCIESLCEGVGEVIQGSPYDAFPTPKALLNTDLSQYNLGYRLRYVYEAALLVDCNFTKLDSLVAPDHTSTEAIIELMRIKGVGIKVASCVAAFSLGHTDLFPIDVWIERAMKEGNIDKEDTVLYGKHAALIQQYIYYYMLHRND